jgi:hypothetical protein
VEYFKSQKSQDFLAKFIPGSNRPGLQKCTKDSFAPGNHFNTVMRRGDA